LRGLKIEIWIRRYPENRKNRVTGTAKGASDEIAGVMAVQGADGGYGGTGFRGYPAPAQPESKIVGHSGGIDYLGGTACDPTLDCPVRCDGDGPDA